MFTVSVFEHPIAEVTVTIYPVLTVGVAVGFEQVLQLNPVDGLHEYVPPPPLVIFTELPMQIVELGAALITGIA